MASKTIDAELAQPSPLRQSSRAWWVRPSRLSAKPELAKSLGYHAAPALTGQATPCEGRATRSTLPDDRRDRPDRRLLHLQPAAGGDCSSHRFWRKFAEIPNVVAIKRAPFNRYQTLDVLRGVAESGRTDIALYTGNDDNIINDLLTVSSEFAVAPACRSSAGSWAIGRCGRKRRWNWSKRFIARPITDAGTPPSPSRMADPQRRGDRCQRRLLRRRQRLPRMHHRHPRSAPPAGIAGGDVGVEPGGTALHRARAGGRD